MSDTLARKLSSVGISVPARGATHFSSASHLSKYVKCQQSLETRDWRLRLGLHSPVANLQSLGLVLTMVVAGILRFYRLDGSSLWSDEGNTWAMLDRNFIAIAQAAAADIHPPGYYWLLKLWASFFGASAFAMRSFSAIAGILLVWLIYQIARLLQSSAHTPAPHSIAILAALIAALNPFQIYYSQEARMYMLLALQSAGLIWATLHLARASAGRWRPAAVYLVCGASGLWTHYSFPLVLAVAVVSFWWLSRRRAGRAFGAFLLLNAVVMLLFLPWLPTALHQVQNWPKGGVRTGWLEGLVLTAQTLLIGPIRVDLQPLWLWAGGALLLPLTGMLRMRRAHAMPILALWLLAPVGLMFALGLFSDAFLKFLLIASPAWSLALAGLGIRENQQTRFAPYLAIVLIMAFAIGLAVLTLPFYYRDATVRDNYAGVARYIAAVGDPAQDLVILDAPGQQEVWRYYDPGLPTLALPAQRPPNPAQTVAKLAEQIAGRRQLFALFWATDEADPDQIVERWLDQHAFKAIDSWQGNLRFVTYAMPNDLHCTPLVPAPHFGPAIELLKVCRPDAAQSVQPADVALVGLRWIADQPITARYKVTLQLLDPRNQVIAQRDGEPAGGAQPTNHWQVGAPVVDNHGLFIPFGSPPGEYGLMVALYDAEHGARLPAPDGDSFILGSLTIQPFAGAPPLDVIPMHYRPGRRLGPVLLAGYDLYRKDSAHAPQTPVAPGELVHFTFYWQAPDPLPDSWPADLQFTLQLGDETITAPLAGGGYPTGAWRAGELVRGEFDLLYDGAHQHPGLRVEEHEMRLAPLPR
jgi:mannosyltransferase